MPLRERIRIRLKAYDHRVLDQSTHGNRRIRPSGPEPKCSGPDSVADGEATCTRSNALAARGQEVAGSSLKIRTHKRLLDILVAHAGHGGRADEVGSACWV